MKTDAGQEKNPCPGLKGGVPRYNKSNGKTAGSPAEGKQFPQQRLHLIIRLCSCFLFKVFFHLREKQVAHVKCSLWAVSFLFITESPLCVRAEKAWGAVSARKRLFSGAKRRKRNKPARRCRSCGFERVRGSRTGSNPFTHLAF